MVSPCGAPGCVQGARHPHLYCDGHVEQWLANGVRPFVHQRRPTGVPDARVEMLRDAEERHPGWLLRHVQRLFDERLGEPGAARSNLCRWDRELAAAERAALRDAKRDNEAYRRSGTPALALTGSAR